MARILSNDIHRTLHIPFVTVGANLGNCFDACNHVSTSVALQAFRVQFNMIALMLLCLQTMNFWLRTAYGVASTPFGGVVDDVCMGLGQGCGGAPTSFFTTLVQMINCYKRQRYGQRFTYCWTGEVFMLAALCYVDDTDLLL